MNEKGASFNGKPSNSHLLSANRQPKPNNLIHRTAEYHSVFEKCAIASALMSTYHINLNANPTIHYTQGGRVNSKYSGAEFEYQKDNCFAR
mmetsp:Transcript_25578/g.33905  ORF Transcript_25578/g.33905 Transcript_25578/m.33905 type:complete len:91 (-) Transcript_25578:268-540(-)